MREYIGRRADFQRSLAQAILLRCCYPPKDYALNSYARFCSFTGISVASICSPATRSPKYFKAPAEFIFIFPPQWPFTRLRHGDRFIFCDAPILSRSRDAASRLQETTWPQAMRERQVVARHARYSLLISRHDFSPLTVADYIYTIVDVAARDILLGAAGRHSSPRFPFKAICLDGSQFCVLHHFVRSSRPH